jgi:uncharacterized membrane protein
MTLPTFSQDNYLHVFFLATAFSLLSLLGAGAALLYGRKTKKFLWREYLALLAVPLLCTLYLVFFVERNLTFMFFFSAVVGFTAEFFLGFFYHKVLGKRLWTYSRMSVGGYTSFLSIPFWGLGGIAFWLTAKLSGL